MTRLTQCNSSDWALRPESFTGISRSIGNARVSVAPLHKSPRDDHAGWRLWTRLSANEWIKLPSKLLCPRKPPIELRGTLGSRNTLIHCSEKLPDEFSVPPRAGRLHERFAERASSRIRYPLDVWFSFVGMVAMTGLGKRTSFDIAKYLVLALKMLGERVIVRCPLLPIDVHDLV